MTFADDGSCRLLVSFSFVFLFFLIFYFSICFHLGLNADHYYESVGHLGVV